MNIGLRWVRAAMLATLALACGRPAMAEDFYKGKSVTLYAGFTPGGGIDSEMRLVAQYLPRHIPGGPNVVPMNMPGAGGILLGNYLTSISKPDGLTLGMPGRTGFVLAGAVGDKSVKYDVTKFTYIGSSAPDNEMLWLRKGLNIRTFAELRASKQTIVIGGLAGASSSVMVPTVLAKYENLPLRVISGYVGLNEVTLAIERGEVDGIYTHAGTFRPDMISSGAVVPLFQSFPVESNLAVVTDLVTDPREKALINLALAPSRLGAPVLAPPDLPADITKILRDAYVEMASSDEYQHDAAKRQIAVGKPSSGAELQAYVARALTGISPEVVAEYMSFVGSK
jgi:tripartite-type tricarboxylate transporter receptor subunit TctC